MKKDKKYIGIFTIIILACIYLCITNNNIENTLDSKNLISVYEEDIIKVHYIDVGQGDATFVELPNKETMLIDAGEKEFGKTVHAYIEECGYNEIDYVVCTHPHTDHIGGMDNVINNMEISCIYMPNAISTSDTFKDLLTLIKKESIATKLGKAGVIILKEDDLEVKLLAPTQTHEELNNNSIIVKITYKDVSFLFTGDAEEESEKEILEDAKCNVVKVGHHGSSTSSAVAFVNACDADYAIISVGKGNSYGHPKTEIIKRWKNTGAKVYRTDENGTVVVISDGENIEVKCEK